MSEHPTSGPTENRTGDSDQPNEPGMEVVEGQLDSDEMAEEKEEGEQGHDGSSSDGDS